MKCRTCFRCRVNASDHAQQAVIKALHAEAETVRPGRTELREIILVHGAGVRLDGAFGRRTSSLPDRLDDPREECGGQHGRCAAADVDRRGIAKARAKRRRFAQDLCTERRRIVLHLRFVRSDRRGDKVTVCTFFYAIGNVGVDAPRFTRQF